MRIGPLLGVVAVLALGGSDTAPRAAAAGPIACESLPRYAREGSPVGDTSTAIHTVDATAPANAMVAARTGWRTTARRAANSTSGNTT